MVHCNGHITTVSNGNSASTKDAGTAITGDNSGGIYVTGFSFGATSMSDYVTLKLNSSNGSQIWLERYDYISLNDVPAKISISGSNIYVAGASQKNASEWELATLSYAMNTGALINNVRSTGSAVQGVDEIKDITVDNLGNIYLTGSVNNTGTGYDIAIYKLDGQLNMIWEQHFDGYGQKDVGNGIKVDDNGNVYVAGYVSTPNEGRNYALLKYNSSGVLQWNKEYNGTANADDEAVQLVLGGMNYVLVTGSARNTSVSAYHTLVYDPNGEMITQAIYENGNLETVPTGIVIDLDGEVIVVGQSRLSGGTYETKAVKYKSYFKPIDVVYVNNEPVYNDREVIIRFDRTAMDYNVINRKGFIAGSLGDFLNAGAVTTLNAHFKTDISGLSTFKIFRRMTTADSLSITRLGDTIKVDDFWATLSVILPEGYPLEDVIDEFNTVDKGLVHYAEPNYIGEFSSIPNDPIYYNFSSVYLHAQTSLNDTLHGINIEEAWSIQTGQKHIKVGVFDTGVNWEHEDFGDGTTEGTKIKGGWNYSDSKFILQSNDDTDGHGTAVAGIIGAIRNNGIGIAGIAGGDFIENNHGVELYSLAIPVRTSGLNNYVLHSSASEAIIEGAINILDTNYTFAFGLHIQNHSWETKMYSSRTLRRAVQTNYENECIFSVASGNDFDKKFLTIPSYPASYNDNWVLKVGASNQDGMRAYFSLYDNNLDFIAPGVHSIFVSLHHQLNSTYISSEIGDGTSFAAPHVTGVAALMLSEHNPLTDTIYPNALAPEDVETILKRTATPVYHDIDEAYTENIPNIFAGYGRINAGEAIKKSSFPYRIRHFNDSINTSLATLYATNHSLTFPEGIEGLPNQEYIGIAEIYKLSPTLSHSIPATENYIDGWVRNSAKSLFGLTDVILNPFWSEITLEHSDDHSATLTGYIYKVDVYDVNNNFVTQKWIPTDLNSKVKFSYSIYTTESDIELGINHLNNEKIQLYPNPSNQLLNIRFQEMEDLQSILIHDVSGRLISATETDKNTENHIVLDISTLKNGVYICTLQSIKNNVSMKFIKE